MDRKLGNKMVQLQEQSLMEGGPQGTSKVGLVLLAVWDKL